MTEHKKDIYLYTDGSCLGNPGPGGYGVVLVYGKHRREISGGFDQTTNNRMELMALIVGLKALKDSCRVHLVSDSQYMIKGINALAQWQAKGWRKVKNVDLWREIAELATKHELTLEWVQGHDVNLGNQRADALARQAASQAHLPIDHGYQAQKELRDSQESLF